MKRNRIRALAATGIAIFTAAAIAAVALASAGSGTSTEILAPRSALSESVEVNQDRIKFQTKDATDLVTQQVTFAPGAYSGWHHHPGVILVLVKSGHVTTHDENCQTKTYGPREAFVESGTEPFMVSNESATETAVDVATQVAPAGSSFRIEDDPPACAT
jgi:quercetin dioxygenase-like cupin family protein